MREGVTMGDPNLLNVRNSKHIFVASLNNESILKISQHSVTHQLLRSLHLRSPR